MVFLDMIDDRFIVRPRDLLAEHALVTDAFPSFVIPGVESFRFEAQVVDTFGRVTFADQTPREVVIEVDLPVPTPIAIVAGPPEPIFFPTFGFFGVPGMVDTLVRSPGLAGGFARDGALFI